MGRVRNKLPHSCVLVKFNHLFFNRNVLVFYKHPFCIRFNIFSCPSFTSSSTDFIRDRRIKNTIFGNISRNCGFKALKHSRQIVNSNQHENCKKIFELIGTGLTRYTSILYFFRIKDKLVNIFDKISLLDNGAFDDRLEFSFLGLK